MNFKNVCAWLTFSTFVLTSVGAQNFKSKPTSGAVEPAVSANSFSKCLECKSSIKKRIAVMPVRVGAIAKDINEDPSAISAITSDKLEVSLRWRENLIVLTRAGLQGVLSEQEMASKGISNAELAPKKGKIIPAELLLQVTLDRVDVSTQVSRTTASNAARQLLQAQQLEREAMKAREDAAEQEIQAANSLKYAEQFRQQQAQIKQQLEQSAQQGTMSRGQLNLGALATALGSYGEQSSTEDAENALSNAKDQRINAERKLFQARQFKEQSERLATTDLEERRTTSGSIVVTWKTLDTLTGEVVGSDTIRLTDSVLDTRSVSNSGITSSEQINSSRAQNLINSLIDASVHKITDLVGENIEKIPFKAQLVKIDRQGVVINAGSNFGVEVGDTFAVRRIEEAMQDPSTGQMLKSEGDLSGLIRVISVSTQVSNAVIIKSAGKIKRGDFLEWVGTYN